MTQETEEVLIRLEENPRYRSGSRAFMIINGRSELVSMPDGRKRVRLSETEERLKAIRERLVRRLVP